MKTLFQITLLVTLVSSLFSAQAQAAITKYDDQTCLQDVNDSFKHSIAVKLKINKETGTTTAIRSMGIHVKDSYCFDSLKTEDESYEFPDYTDQIKVELKCYKNLKLKNHYYLVNEWVNLQTGMTLHLKYINEFISEEDCLASL